MSSRQSFLQRTRLRELQEFLEGDIRASRGVGLDGIRPGDIPRPLDQRWNDVCRHVQARLRDGRYDFTPYRELLISKGRDRPPRVLSIPTIRDRLALKAAAVALRDVYGYSGPEIAQRKVGKLSGVTRSWGGFVRIDLKDYFGSIDHSALLGTLRPRVRSGVFREAVLAALVNPTVEFGPKSVRVPNAKGIPQGLSISSVLAEIFLETFDDRWESDPSLKYFRYVDDIAVLCDRREAETIFERLHSELADLGLEAHPLGTSGKSLVGDMGSGFDYLGYHFTTKGVSVSEIAMRRIEDQIAQVFSSFRRRTRDRSTGNLTWLQWKISRLACGCIHDGEHRGWLRFYARTADLSALHHLDALIESLARRSGVPDSVQFKKFIRAYWVTRSGQAWFRYIPNPSAWDEPTARTHLVEVEGWDKAHVDALSSFQLLRALERTVSRDISNLERDLDPSS
jgi:hypothetical protein